MILIKNSTLVDGTGAPRRKADLLIKDGRIVAIGDLKQQQADIRIDGEGMITTPGFIDVNTDSDHYLSLFTDPAQQDFLLQGVTTIIGGHCGSSLAPLIKGSLESIRKWADISMINVDWNTMGEFLATLEKLPLGVNFGTLVGHATIRRALLGDVLRDLTVSELEMLRSVARQALKEGALGVSTGLGYNHARNTPYAEVLLLAQLAREYGGVYTTHLRNEREGLLGAVSETISIAKEAGARTIISHFRALKGYEAHFEEALAMIEHADADVWFDAYPFGYSIIPIYTLLPEWAQQGSLEQMRDLLAAAHTREQILASFADIHGADITIARAPGFDFLVGKTLEQYARGRELSVPEALMYLLVETKLKAVVFRNNISFAETAKALLSPRALVASNSPSLLESRSVIENERAAKTFSTFMNLVSGHPATPLEWAVHKCTGQAAAAFNLSGRGTLTEGAIADVVLLRGTQAVTVIVGGEVAVRDGAFQGVYNGSIIRRK